jgi:hypothetical protein
MGFDAIPAAVSSIKLLALAEIICIAAGLAAVILLPKIHIKKENINEAKG